MPKKKAPAPLANLRHELFVREYVVELNCTQAYRAVYPKSSEKAAKVGASRLLTIANVKARVAELQKPRFDALEITADRVAQELGRIAFSRIDEYNVDESGRIVLDDDAHPDAMGAIASCKYVAGVATESKDGGDITMQRSVEIKLWNKNTALDSLAKHLGMYQNPTDPGAVLVPFIWGESPPGWTPPTDKDLSGN